MDIRESTTEYQKPENSCILMNNRIEWWILSKSSGTQQLRSYESSAIQQWILGREITGIQ